MAAGPESAAYCIKPAGVPAAWHFDAAKWLHHELGKGAFPSALRLSRADDQPDAEGKEQDEPPEVSQLAGGQFDEREDRRKNDDKDNGNHHEKADPGDLPVRFLRSGCLGSSSLDDLPFRVLFHGSRILGSLASGLRAVQVSRWAGGYWIRLHLRLRQPAEYGRPTFSTICRLTRAGLSLRASPRIRIASASPLARMMAVSASIWVFCWVNRALAASCSWTILASMADSSSRERAMSMMVTSTILIRLGNLRLGAFEGLDLDLFAGLDDSLGAAGGGHFLEGLGDSGSNQAVKRDPRNTPDRLLRPIPAGFGKDLELHIDLLEIG